MHKDDRLDDNLPDDWGLIDRSIAEAYGYTPQQIADLTLTEKYVLCQDSNPDDEAKARLEAEIAKFVRLYREASNEVKLEYAAFERRMLG